MFRFWSILLLCTLLPHKLSGQSVGVVLSGGGSKGLAHIGVIKALEENRIPIDFIGGTSMGAIIGSLYAMGITPDEMMDIVRSEDFSYWITGTLEEKYRYYFKSEYPGPDLFSVGLDFKDTIPKTRLPMSMIPNYLMDFAFMEIFSRASAAAGYDFDSLFVPFLCNSADISNNRELVSRSGDLAQAVRASMTVPLYFRPVLIDGNIMYDGGIFNNFPINHVKRYFNPDIIIGSKAAAGNTPPDEFDIFAQIENIVMKPSSYDIPPGEGVLLDMGFNNQSLLSFEKLDYFVNTGYQIAMQNMDSIKMLIHRQAPDNLELGRQRNVFKESWPELRFKDFDIQGLNEKQEIYVEKSLRKTGAVIGVEEVKREYLKLVSDQSLFYLYPRAIYDETDSLFTLRLRVVPEAPMEARFGLFIASTGMAQTYLGFSYREISEVSSHLMGSLQFGRLYDGINLGLRFDYPSRIPLYFMGSFNYNRFDYNTYNSNLFFTDLKPSYVIENEINFRIDVGVPYSINGLFKGGLGIGRNMDIYYMTKDFTTSDTSDFSNLNLFSLYGSVEKNTLNKKQFSTEGSAMKIALRFGYGVESYIPGSTSMRVLNEKLDYLWLCARYEKTGYLPASGSLSLGYHYSMQLTFKPLLSNYFSTIIEAPVFQPNIISKSLFMKDYRAHHFIAAGLMPVYTFNNQVHAKIEAYVFFPVQEILSDANNDAYLGTYFNSMKTMFNASLNVVSVAGPVGFHVGYVTEEEKPWVLQLSFGYLLFNKRSTDE